MLSNKRHRIYPGSGRGGRTSSSGVLKALYCSAPGVPLVGLLQARRERKRGFQVRGEVIGGVVLCCVVCFSVCPLRLGVRSPFIYQGESESHARRAI
jgi:hypothetical protein